jgi:hypothetical protein
MKARFLERTMTTIAIERPPPLADIIVITQLTFRFSSNCNVTVIESQAPIHRTVALRG